MTQKGLPSSLDLAYQEAESVSFGLPKDVDAQIKQQRELAAQRRAEAEKPLELPELPQQGQMVSTGKGSVKVPYMEHFTAAAQRYGVPVNVLIGLAEQESHFKATALGTQTKWGRAKGLMQYLDSTAAGMGINPYDPGQSIDAAAKQLKQRLDKGYSMIDAVREHFAGPDRKLWGSKTHTYGIEVMQRASRYGNIAPISGGVASPSAAQQTRSTAQSSNPDSSRFRPLSATELKKIQDAQMNGDDEVVLQIGMKPIKIQGGDPQIQKQRQQKIDDAGILSQFGNALSSGYDNTTRHVGNAVWMMTGENTSGITNSIYEGYRQQQQAQKNRTSGQKRLDAAIDAVGDGDGFLDTLSRGWNAVKVAVQEPRATFLGSAESAASMLPTLAGAAGGAAGGAGVGAGIGAVAGGAGAAPGAVAGAIWGSRVGMVAGTTATEAGAELEHMVFERLKKQNKPVTKENIQALLNDPNFRADAQKQGATKGLTLAMVDQLTMGAAGRVLSAPAKQAEKKAVREIVKDTGVDEKAARSLLASPAGRAALAKHKPSTLKKAVAATGAFAVELMGEPAGEAISQAVARGEVDWSDVTGEFIYGAGSAVAGTAAAGAINAGQATADRMRSGANTQAAGTTPGVAAEQPARKVGSIERAVGGEQSLDAAIDAELAAVNGQPQPDSIEQLINQQTGTATNEGTTTNDGITADQWLGPVGQTVEVSPKEDPDSTYTVKIEGYENGEVFARDQDGTPVQFGQDDVVSATPVQQAAPVTEDVQLEQGQAPELTDFGVMASEPAAAAKPDANLSDFDDAAPKAAPDTPKAAPVEVDSPEKILAKMDEAELRARIKYLAGQAKATGGWNKRLMAERQQVESEINRHNKPEISDKTYTKWEGMNPAQRQAMAENAGFSSETAKDLSSRSWGEIDKSITDKLTAKSAPKPKAAKAPEVKQPEAKKPEADYSDAVPEQKQEATQEAAPFRQLIIDAHFNNPPMKAQLIQQEIQTGRPRHEVMKDVQDIVADIKAGKITAPTAQADPIKPSIEGKDLGEGWSEFSKDSGTIGIPRADMPQIKAEHRGAMVNFMNARGIDHKEDTVAADSLKPTQKEFSKEKVKKASEREGGDRSILISKDDHVLDGHHQWMAAREKGEDVKVIRLDAPIKDLVDAAHEFPSSTVDDAASSAAPSDIKTKTDTPSNTAYRLPEHEGKKYIYEDWMGSRGSDYAPTDRQMVLIDATKQALNELQETARFGVVTNDDLQDRVAKILNVPQNILDLDTLNVKGGDFGYDVYHARQHIESSASLAKQREALKRLNLSEGEKIGTIVLNDGKLAQSTVVESFNEQQVVLTGTRGGKKYKFTTHPIGLVSAIKRAVSEGKRKDNPLATAVETEQGAAPSVAKTEAVQPKAKQTEKSKPSANTLVSDDRAAELRKRLKAKLTQLNSGIDPEILAIGAELAVYHIERGARTFAAFAKNVAADLDVSMETLRPYLRSFYNGARDMMEDMGADIDGMDSADVVRSELAKLDAGETTSKETATQAAPEAKAEPDPTLEPQKAQAGEWSKAPDADNTWINPNGMIIAREPFDYNGKTIDVFNVYRDQSEQAAGNYVATKDSLQKAKDYADQLDSKKGRTRPATKTTQGEDNVSSTSNNLEPDSGNANTGESIISDTDGNARETDAESTGRASQDVDGEQRTGQRDQRLSTDGTTTGREPGNQRVHRDDGQFEPSQRTTGDPERTGSRVDGEQGSTVEQGRADAIAADAPATGTSELDQRLAAQRKADKTPTKWGDKDSIDAALPLLLPEQRDDVLKAEKRLADHNGILFTNGTGTGKTATGMGVAKRFINAGKDNIAIVVPSDKIASDWVKFAKMLGVDLKQLDGVTDNGGSGPVVTTYANFGQNETLAQRDWDLIIPDESHYLSSNESGDSTAALDQLRGLTGHHNGFYDWVRRRYPDKWNKYRKAVEAKNAADSKSPKYAQLEAKELQLRKEWNDFEAVERKKWNDRWASQKDLPKVAMLSATPFAYVKNTDYAEGYLFHYVEPSGLERSRGQGGGYNSGSPRDQFMMQNFGYRMRTNKLTAPESGVNSQLLEQQFNEQLKKTGALSGRKLEVPYDYDRKFVLVDDAVGTKIDNALKFLREKSLEAGAKARESGDPVDITNAERWSTLSTSVDKLFDYQSRMYLLESIKAKAAVAMINDHLRLGRKVVVFHDYNKGGGFDPFTSVITAVDKPEQRAFNQRIINSRPDIFQLDLKQLRSPIDTLTAAFPQALLFNGTVSKGQRRANADKFNTDGTRDNIIIVQSDAGREGVSLHDTTGKHQRVEINLGMPVKPVAATQIEGRIYRTGQQSNAIFRYLTTGTAWEASAFASKIAERASTAENLALGSEARGLKESFIDAYQSADVHHPGENDGIGGKDYDRKLSASNSVSPFDKAKTFYWAQQKNSKRRDQREGVDYFATPEPVGFKMAEWAGIKTGEKVLEPSAGHGAIARFFPEQADVTMIEPSYDLSQRAGLANGTARIINDTFENLHINNKYDAIVMNPPYGNGGKISTDHLMKAATHLRDGGRIVALLPRGGMADNRLAGFLNSEEAKEMHVVARINMPSSTFERAGTAVNTQILILEKHKNASDATGITEQRIDLTDAKDVSELFDRMENLTIEPRKESTSPESKFEITEYINDFGKTIRGTILTGINKSEAQQIDPYPVRMKNEAGKQGWFIREQWLAWLPKDTKFSRANAVSTGTTATEVREALANRFGEKTIAKLEKDGTLNIIDVLNEPGVEGFTTGGKVTLVADALTADSIVPVFLHELGGHVGFQGTMKPEAYKNLMDQFDKLVAANDPIALEAKRLAEREADPTAQQAEYLPYLVTVAARAQNQRPGIKTLINRVVSAVKAWAMGKLGVNINLNANDILALAERMVSTVAENNTQVTNDTVSFSRADNDLGPVDQQEYNSKLGQWWSEVKQRPADMLTNSMRGWGLNIIPLRPMLTELAKDIPAAKTYLRIKDQMDSMRNEWHAKTDAVSQTWLKYRIKNREENRDLMDLMHEATLAQVDPSQPFESIMTARELTALETLAQDHPNRKNLEEKAKRDAQRQEIYNKLKKRFDVLSPEAKSVFNQVRDAYSDMADAFDKTLLNNMEKAINVRIKKAEREHKREMERIQDEGLQGDERTAAVAAADRKLKTAKTKIAWNRKARMTQLRQQFETQRLAGPYFPLARFGEFFVTVRDAESGEVVSFSRFENATDQRRFADDMRKDKDYKVEVGALNDATTTRKSVDPNFVADVEDILADLPNAEQVKDEVWQRYLESLPDMSIRKARIHRKGRAGYTADAVRAFGHHLFHGSHQLARMAHSMDLDDALDQARDEARETKDPTRSSLIVNEMEKRHQFVMSPTGGQLATWASSFAFVWYLAGSPKAAIMNLFQTPIMGVPILGAYAGGLNGMARAGNQLTRALVDFTSGKGYAERSARLTDEERNAMQKGYETGIIEKTQGHELAGVAESGVEYNAVRERAMKVIAWGFHHTERLNREVTFLAGYRLARAKGESHDQSITTAADLTWKTHFDYANTSRPRLMHNDTMKILLVFRNFQINMLFRLFRDIHQVMHADSKESRREALTQLSGITGMMMLNAGITGTWGFGIAMLMAGLFMEDGEDPEEELKKGMVNTLGPNLAGLALYGVPGHVTGTALSESVGMPDLWFRSPDSEKEGEEALQFWQSQLLGAVPSIGAQFARGLSYIGKGEEYRGIETMMPKMLKDPMKSYRFATEGAKNMKGDTVADVTWQDVVKQATGFTPARISEQYKINNLNYNKQQQVLKARKELMDGYYKAVKADDNAAVDEVISRIEKHNEKNPDQPITPKGLIQSIKTRERGADNAVGGMRYNTKLRDRILEEQAPSIYK